MRDGSLVFGGNSGRPGIESDRDLDSPFCLWHAAPDRRSFRRPNSPSPSVCLTSRLSRHSATCHSVDRTQPKDFPPSAPSGQTRFPQSEALLMFDPCPFVRAPMAVSARAILDSTLQRTTTRLGADQRAAFLGQGSQGFDALDTMRRHHWRADLTPSPRMSRRLDDEIRRSNAVGRVLVSNNCTPWLELVASLGRRRTSTVNDGTVRLNEVLDQLTAGGLASAITCEPKRGKALRENHSGNQLVASPRPSPPHSDGGW